MNAKPGWNRQDLDAYLSERYVCLDRDLLEELVDTGSMPGRRFELRGREAGNHGPDGGNRHGLEREQGERRVIHP